MKSDDYLAFGRTALGFLLGRACSKEHFGVAIRPCCSFVASQPASFRDRGAKYMALVRRSKRIRTQISCQRWDSLCVLCGRNGVQELSSLGTLGCDGESTGDPVGERSLLQAQKVSVDALAVWLGCH